MIPDQQELYDRLIRNFTNKITDDGNEVNIAGGAAMLMQLRKAANHPLLHRTHYTDERIQEMSKVLAQVKYEQRYKKSCLCGFQSGPIQNRLYSRRDWQEA